MLSLDIKKLKMDKCSNCNNLLKLYKHPSNVHEFHKGNMTEKAHLYACVVSHIINEDYTATILEHGNGLCELYEPKIK